MRFDRNGHLHLRERGADMRRHIVEAFSVMHVKALPLP
jgi:hypothetical protein